MLLEKLSPVERAAYVLRAAFDYPHRQIAQVLGLTEANARQLVTRARMHLSSDRRRRVGAADHEGFVKALVYAAQTGDLAGSLKSFEAAVKLKPDLAEAHYYIGVGRMLTGDVAGAAHRDADEGIHDAQHRAQQAQQRAHRPERRQPGDEARGGVALGGDLLGEHHAQRLELRGREGDRRHRHSVGPFLQAARTQLREEVDPLAQQPVVGR